MYSVVKGKMIVRRIVERLVEMRMIPLSLPICASNISGELYGLATWSDEVESFLANQGRKIFVTLEILWLNKKI